MVKRRISDAVLAEILDMGNAGFTAKDTAMEVGVSVPTVLSVYREYKIEVGPPGRRTLLDRLGDEAIEDILHRYQNTEETVQTIIQDYNLSYQQFYKILNDLNIVRRTHAKERLEGKKAQMDVAIGHYLDGMPLWKIHQETGIHQPQLHKEIHKRGISLRRPNATKNDESED